MKSGESRNQSRGFNRCDFRFLLFFKSANPVKPSRSVYLGVIKVGEDRMENARQKRAAELHSVEGVTHPWREIPECDSTGQSTQKRRPTYLVLRICFATCGLESVPGRRFFWSALLASEDCKGSNRGLSASARFR